MDIYIVTGVLDEYNYTAERTTHSSFNKETNALNHAVSMANGEIGVGGTDSIYKLDLIIKFNTVSLKAIPMKLVLEDGRFQLKEKNS